MIDDKYIYSTLRPKAVSYLLYVTISVCISTLHLSYLSLASLNSSICNRGTTLILEPSMRIVTASEGTSVAITISALQVDIYVYMFEGRYQYGGYMLCQ